MLYDLCKRSGIAFRRCGKWLLAQSDEDIAQLELLRLRCRSLFVPLEWLPNSVLKAEEPNVIAKAVLFSPSTGIVSVHELLQCLEAQIVSNGGVLALETNVVSARRCKDGSYELSLGDGSMIVADCVINSAGLWASKVAAMPLLRLPAGYQTYFCKGHYFGCRGTAAVQRLVYPMPEKHLQSLGVHATIDLNGRVRFGPDVSYVESATDYSLDERRIPLAVEAISKYLRGITVERLYVDYCGIRPKLTREGEEARDFIINEESDRGLSRWVNLLGIESPGLTASLAIAEYVAMKLT